MQEVLIYDYLTSMYTRMNTELFDGSLPACVITLKNKKGALGFFKREAFSKKDNQLISVDELALNPVHFGRSPKEIASTLVHEMVHVWQAHFGNAPKTGYHNKQWAKKMIEVGLMPSATGCEGGSQVGQRMTHYIIKDGKFDKIFDKIYFNVEIIERLGAQKTKRQRNKTKYICPSCGTNIWGKPNLTVECKDCGTLFEEQG
jgi:hypothetical protein